MMLHRRNRRRRFYGCVVGMSRGHRIDGLRDVQSDAKLFHNARRASIRACCHIVNQRASCAIDDLAEALLNLKKKF